jgi:hypothetical protein
MGNLKGLPSIVSELRAERTHLANQLKHVDAALSVLGKFDSGSSYTKPRRTLRVCSYLRTQYYSVISNAKEREMREGIREKAPLQYAVTGPLRLPDPKLPDIDILVKDSKSSAVLVAELKWPRKTIRVVEHLDRDAELEEGFQQLREVRAFLERFPDYLQERGVVISGESQTNLSYSVITRDHLTYIPQPDGLWLTEFDALVWALQSSENLSDALHKLQTYEWLPVEGRDFTVRFESATVAGVTIDAEIFHRPPGIISRPA